MRLSIERLRWMVVAAGLLLVLALAGIIEYGRYIAKIRFKAAVSHFLHSEHETRNFTYSNSLLGRTDYTVHAGRVVQHGDGTYSGFDVRIELYSKTSSEIDRIYANEIEYDQNTGVAKAIGEVRMELEVPQSMAGTRHGMQAPPTSAASPQVVFVETSGVTYLRKLDVAATQEDVHFRWGRLTCSAHGAEFLPGESTMRLLANVHATGDMRGQPFDLIAASALVDRTANVVKMERPSARSGARSGHADSSVAFLRKDGSVDHGSATGSVVLAEGTSEVHAAQLDAALTDGSQLRGATLSGGVTMTDSNPLRPMQGGAQTVDAAFDADGTISRMVARGQAAVTFAEQGTGGGMLHRSMRGDTITADFVHGTVKPHAGAAVLTMLHAAGSAQASGEALAAATGGKPAEMRSNAVHADDLVAKFVANGQGKPLLQTLTGTGHTLLEESGADGQHSESRGDTLQMAFAATVTGSAQLATTTQDGHVTMSSRSAAKAGATTAPTVSTGSASRGVYEAASDAITLTGGTHFSDGHNSITASEVTVHQGSGDAEARGSVVASIEGQTAKSSMEGQAAGTKAKAASGAEQPVTHVAAAEAKFIRNGKLAEFQGTDAAPARLWQGGSQVQAADLLFDGARRSLTARPTGAGGVVRAVFVSRGGAASKPRAGRVEGQAATAETIVHVTSPAMTYSDADRKALFSGGVHMEGTSGVLDAQRAMITLTPAGAAATPETASPVNGSIERMVLYGDVRMRQPGRTGIGEQLTYTAAQDEYVLSGTPAHLPRIVDAAQGLVTGTTLVFSGAGSTIIVGGAPGQPNGRVRTETEVRH
jgi:lipopolysaccharide export system protein LptA